MKLVLNTTIGPAVLCDDCFELVKKEHPHITYEDITRKIPPEYPCDRCGCRAVMPINGFGGTLSINGIEVAEVKEVNTFLLR